MAIMEKTLKLSIRQVSEHLKEGPLRLAELHNPGVATALIAVIGKRLVERFPNREGSENRTPSAVLARPAEWEFYDTAVWETCATPAGYSPASRIRGQSPPRLEPVPGEKRGCSTEAT